MRLLSTAQKNQKNQIFFNHATYQKWANDDALQPEILEILCVHNDRKLVEILVDDVLSCIQGDVNFYINFHRKYPIEFNNRIWTVSDDDHLRVLKLRYAALMTKDAECLITDLNCKPPWTLEFLRESFQHCESLMLESPPENDCGFLALSPACGLTFPKVNYEDCLTFEDGELLTSHQAQLLRSLVSARSQQKPFKMNGGLIK